MSEQQQQVKSDQIPGAIITPQDEPPVPVEVDLESGTASEESEQHEQRAEPERKPDEKKPVSRSQQRIHALTHEIDAERSARQRLEQELAEARREAQENRQRTIEAERVGMENHAARIKAELAASKAALKAAKESADADAEVEAQARLAKAAAEEADAEAWLAANPKREQQPQQRQEPREQRQARAPEIQPVSAPVRDFIAENSWFSSVQLGSDGRPLVDQRTGRMVSNPDFDEDLHDIAMLEHKRIQREVNLGRLDANYIESPEYFERITQAVRTAAPDVFEGEEEQQAPPARQRTPSMGAAKQPVAPSSRQIPGTPPKRSGEKMKLSGDEADLVRSLVDNGTLVYSRAHPDPNKRGQKMSYNDAYVEYARNKQADIASGKHIQQQ